MNTEHDIIRRLQAIRQLPVDTRATGRALERTRAAIVAEMPVHHLPDTKPATQGFRGWAAGLPRLRMVGVAVAAAVLIAAIIITVPGSSPTAFAAMMHAVEETSSVTCEITTEEYAGAPPSKSTAYFSANGDYRIVGAGGSYIVHDFSSSRTLIANSEKQQAILLTGTPSTDQRVNLYVHLRRLQDAAEAEVLGTETIDGVAATKLRIPFTADQLRTTVTIWIDPDTNLPVRLNFAAAEDAEPQTHQTFSALEFDANLPPAIFSLEPPAGFEIVAPTADASR